MPNLLIIAGPNGAGKTSFAKEYLSKDGLRFIFVNADEIARTLVLEGGVQSRSDIRAGRLMLDRIDDLVMRGADLAIETTLATLTYARKIHAWREQGYNVTLMYLKLGSIEESLDRVRKRVEAGGHNIPSEIIARRFSKSADYFEKVYKPIVNHWYVWESHEGRFALASSSEQP